MNAKPVYELLNRDDPALDGYPEVGPDSAGAIGIYTGLGVSDSEDPDILIFLALIADADLAHLTDDDPEGHYVSGIWARLPCNPEIATVLNAAVTQLQSRFSVPLLLDWCEDIFAPKNDDTLAAIGYG